MTLLCLIGRHGSGKSTLGTMLVNSFGATHYSLGTLLRLAKRGVYPNDVPAELMLALSRHPWGQPLPERMLTHIIGMATRLPLCVLDGLPALPGQLAYFPKATRFVLVLAPRKARAHRLALRAQHTRRVWHPDRENWRDAALAQVIWTCRQQYRLAVIRNDVDGGADLQRGALGLGRSLGWSRSG